MNVFIVLGSLLMGYGVFVELKKKKSTAPGASSASSASVVTPAVNPTGNINAVAPIVPPVE